MCKLEGVGVGAFLFLLNGVSMFGVRSDRSPLDGWRNAALAAYAVVRGRLAPQWPTAALHLAESWPR